MRGYPNLYHYSACAVPEQLNSYGPKEQLLLAGRCGRNKPVGLWVSCCDDFGDDGEPLGWHEWCVSESWGIGSLAHRYSVRLKPSAKVLLITTAQGVQDFTDEWGAPDIAGCLVPDWATLAQIYQGVIISPYQWTVRFEPDWYYGWDCASGCIWDASAIESITLLEPRPIPSEVAA